jgi:hypothetical protein
VYHQRLPTGDYQITTHKIQVFDEPDQTVERQLLPQLPGGETNDDEDANAKKDNDNLLAAFTMKKKIQNGH